MFNIQLYRECTMFCHMRAQWFIDTAYVSDLFQITVHPLVTGYRQDHSFFQAFRMCLVLLQNHPWNVQQWNVTHVVRLFPGFSYPVLAIDILYYVFISQVLYIGKGQPGQRTKHEYVPDRLQAGDGEFLFIHLFTSATFIIFLKFFRYFTVAFWAHDFSVFT